MTIVYEPRGKAREYSPLAANLYSGCGHKCSYCYVPNVLNISRQQFDNDVHERNEIIKKLEKDAKKIAYSDKQVFMSFTTDPYNPINDKLQLTRQALEIFLMYKIPISILTKSGMKALQDLDVIKKFGQHIKIGASMTYDNDLDSQRIEKGAALPNERLLMLETFHKNNVRTWISFEPIIQPEQMLNLLNQSLGFVSEYQFGKLSGDKRDFDWNYYVKIITDILRPKQIPFYIKDTLKKAANKIKYEPDEINQDFLLLKPFNKEQNLKFAI